MSKITKDFHPRSIRIEPTDDKLSQASGLGSIVEAFDQSALSQELKPCLPSRSHVRSLGSYRLALIQISSSIYGHDCMDDLEEFRDDPLLEAVMKGETVAPRTMGDFLRDFEEEHITSVNNFLSKQSQAYRRQLIKFLPLEHKPSRAPHLSIDSTSHVQRGEKMEGLAWNYKDEWCLDSQVVFDELGFCYGMQLRPGNTRSGVQAEGLIRSAFEGFKYRDEKYLSADSAYCNQEVMKTCLGLGARFTIAANQATTGWEDSIPLIHNWEPWVYSDEEIQKAAQARKKTLPEVELGSFHWRPSWSESLILNVVVKRTKKDQLTLFESGFEHYAVITNISLFDWGRQKVFEHYSRRANAENFIREEKYNYDLKHFPCQKLMANHAYGLLTLIGHNVLRWIALLDRPDRPHFAKKLRRRFVYIPGRLIEHARQLVLRIPQRYYQEVMRLREAWTPSLIASFSTA